MAEQKPIPLKTQIQYKLGLKLDGLEREFTSLSVLKLKSNTN